MAAKPKPAKEPVACGRPGCRKTFIPAHRNHLYCSTACKMTVVHYRHALGIGRR